MYTLNALCAKAYQELLESGLKEKTVYGANWYIWNRLIREYGGDSIFNETMVYTYCRKHFNKDIFAEARTNLNVIEKRYLLAFNRLIKSSNGEIITKRNLHYYRDFALNEQLSGLLEGYISKAILDGNSETTINNKKMRIKKFIIDIDFANINSHKIKQYLEEKKRSQRKVSYVTETRLIRNFLVYCYEKKAISREILLAWPDKMSNNYAKDIPSIYSNDEIKELLKASKNYINEDNHLRNYAILVLITYSGIRIGDVVSLKINDVDWRNNNISFIQQKTKRKHCIPLIPEIGNALINYLINERKAGSMYLFTKEDGNKMISASVTTIINNYFCISPIEIENRHYGPHSLRHSIATNLINKSMDAFSVANVLGHSNIDCVRIYAKVDLVNLRKCVLEGPYNA